MYTLSLGPLSSAPSLTQDLGRARRYAFLAGRALLRMATGHQTEPVLRRPPGRSGARRQRWVIGRAGTGAAIEIDDPQALAEHAWLEVDTAGRWWISEGAVLLRRPRGDRTMLQSPPPTEESP